MIIRLDDLSVADCRSLTAGLGIGLFAMQYIETLRSLSPYPIASNACLSTEVGEEQVIVCPFTVAHDAVLAAQGVSPSASGPVLHPVTVTSGLKGENGAPLALKALENGDKLFYGVMPAQSVLYVPTGMIVCRRSLSLCYGYRICEVVACPSSQHQLKFILDSIVKFQGGEKVKDHPQFKGMLATQAAVDKCLALQKNLKKAQPFAAHNCLQELVYFHFRCFVKFVFQ